MNRRKLTWTIASAFCLAAASGCMYVPRSQLAVVEAQSRALAEQNRSQLGEIENLRAHTHKLEDKLIEAEVQLAKLDEGWTEDRKRLAALEGELTDGRGQRLPPGLSAQLAQLSRRFPNLEFDELTGAAKLNSDVLFDSGEAELKEDAEELLSEFARIMRSPAARDLKLMVVGHTDGLKIARRDVRERFADNFHLSAARALAVADLLRQAGVPDDRIGVSGFGGEQPIASNATVEQRRRNRRVEIFVLPPDAPVVGWTETTTSLY